MPVELLSRPARRAATSPSTASTTRSRPRRSGSPTTSAASPTCGDRLQPGRVPAHHHHGHVDDRRQADPAGQRSTRSSRRRTEWAEDHGTLGVKVVDRTTTKGVARHQRHAPRRDRLHAAATWSPTPTAARSSSRCRSARYTVTLDQARLPRPQPQPEVDGQPDGRRQEGQLRHDAVRQGDQRPRQRQDAHPRAQVYAAAEAKTSKAVRRASTNGAFVGMKRTSTPATAISTFDVAPLFPFDENSYTLLHRRLRATQRRTRTSRPTPNYFTTTNPAAALLADPTMVAAAGGRRSASRRSHVRADAQRAAAPTPIGDTNVARLRAAAAAVGVDRAPAIQPVYELHDQGLARRSWGTHPPGGAAADHWLSQTGTDFDPGLPFGNYTLCVLDSTTARPTAPCTAARQPDDLQQHRRPTAAQITDLGPTLVVLRPRRTAGSDARSACATRTA